MKKILFVLIAFSFCLSADSPPESTSLSSSSADYNGNTLVLKGNVLLDHGLGKMRAEQAFLEKQEPGRDFPFSFIRLQKDVHVALPEQAALTCETADFDFVSLKGTLLPKDQEKVCYINQKNAIRLMSHSIELEMNKVGFDGKKTAYNLQNIKASDDVIIDYAKTFTLRAHQALYENLNDEESITAYPQSDNHSCYLSHEGDEITSRLIHLDLKQSRLSFQKPVGKLLSSLVPHMKQAEIAFHAEQLIWDHLKNLLSLKGNVHVYEPSLGTIESDGIIQIAQSRIEGKRLCKSIRSQGKTILKYEGPSLQSSHQLITQGAFNLDLEHMRISIDSPLLNGKVVQEKQLSYTESELTLFADKALLEYALVDEELQPVSLLLKGNVKISSSKEGPALCGLSDRVLLSPATKTLILSADPNKKVLFWDEEQGVRISSQEIHVTQDPSTNKKAIKGVGNVKFAFSTEESALLNKLFPNYKASYE